MKTVKLSKIAEKYGLKEIDAHKILLRHSNDIGTVLMSCDNDGDFIVPEVVDLELLNAFALFCSFIIPEEALSELGNDINPKKGFYIYFLYDGNVLVYIGQTVNLRGRVVEHMKDKEFNIVKYLPVNKEDMTLIEYNNIRHYRPICNSDVWSNQAYFKFLLRSCDFV